MDIIFFYFTLICYLLATIGYLSYLILMKKPIWKGARLLLIAGFCMQSLSIVARAIASGHTPGTNRFEALMVFSWLLVGVYLIVQWRRPQPVIGAFFSPVVLGMLFLASTQSKEIEPLKTSLDSVWLPWHVLFAFLGDALLGLAACFAAMYLIQERQLKKKKINFFYFRLPPLALLDRLSSLCISYGFLFLNLGILSGVIWLKTLEGSYMGRMDGRQAAVFFTWFIYAALLHGRLVAGWQGRRVAWLNIIGFTVTLVSFLGLSHFMT